MGNLTRKFRIPLLDTSSTTDSADLQRDAEIVLHEPAMTADNLGLKTWASSFLLAKRLVLLRSSLPKLQPYAQLLELGAGTGLVGLAAAVILHRPVILTDLPEIVPNLERNVEANAALLSTHDAFAGATILDWTMPTKLETSSSESLHQGFPLILAADPIYSPDHPRMFVETIEAQLAKHPDARVVIELPLREAYVTERGDLVLRMEELGLQRVDEGEEVGYDDWSDDKDGEQLAEVRCWWTVWGWQVDVIKA